MLVNQKLAAAAVAVVVGATVTYWALPRASDLSGRVQDASASPRLSAASVPVAPVKARGGRDLAAGRTFVYDVAASRTMGAPGAAPSVATDIRGTLSFTVVGAAEEGAALRVVLASPSRTDRPVRAGADVATLGTPFFVVMGESGAITGWYFPRAMPGESRRQLRSIVSGMQWVAGEGATWDSPELDEAGQYVGRYQLDGTSVTKSKLHYDLVRTPQGLVPVATVGKYELGGATRFAMGAGDGGWPSSVDEDLTTTVSFQGGRLGLSAKMRARLVSSGEDRQYLGSFEVARPSFDPDTDALAEDAALALRNADRGLVQGASFGGLVGDYEASTEHKGRARAVARLGALMRTSPESVREARARLLAKDTKEATGRALASALGAAGTKEAQQALADALASKDVPVSVKNDAAISLGLTENPTAEARTALKGAMTQSSDVSQTAALALGNMAGSLAKEGQDATDIVDDLLAKLAAATTSEQKVLFLDALGNTGDARALPAIRAHLAEGDASVRLAATAALRFQKSDEVDPTLALMVRDPEVLVRKAALSAMSQRPVQKSLVGLRHVVENEPVKELRKTAIRILARAMDTVPEAEQILAWAAQHDADPEVKKAAEDALSRPK
ncbi:MAG: HEAT repeat domain-containing protein [Polyangiaceae bacterium]|nr:HEAT repeat domain-containing protein [Polyangiaceae bacterium]